MNQRVSSDTDDREYPCLINKLTDGSGFIIEYLDLPGAFAIEATQIAVLRAGERIKDAWLKQAEQLGMVPSAPGTTRLHTGQMRLRVPQRLHRALHEWAEMHHTSMNHAVVQLITRAIVKEFAPFRSPEDTARYLSVLQRRNRARRPLKSSAQKRLEPYPDNWMQRFPPMVSTHLIAWAAVEGVSANLLAATLLQQEVAIV